MKNDILSRIGFMTQSDKTVFEKRFELPVDKTEKLERDVSDLSAVVNRLESVYKVMKPGSTWRTLPELFDK